MIIWGGVVCLPRGQSGVKYAFKNSVNRSRPFHTNIDHKIFTPDESVHHMLGVIDGLTMKDTGKVFYGTAPLKCFYAQLMSV